jgi:hypothetical protein
VRDGVWRSGVSAVVTLFQSQSDAESRALNRLPLQGKSHKKRPHPGFRKASTLG